MKSAKELYQERSKRVDDAIHMRVPDRVPIVPDAEFFPFLYSGISVQEGMYDYSKAYQAWKKMVTDFQFDEYVAPFVYSGPVMDILDFKQLKWPGHGLSAMQAYQFLEPGTGYAAMPAEDYDAFMDDPSDYMIHKYFPEIFGALKPLAKLPSIHDVICWYQGVFDILPVIGAPETVAAFEALLKAAKEANRWFGTLLGFIGEMAELGFPTFTLAVTHAPYDYIGNFLRGTTGISMDLHRCPDKLLACCEKVTPWMIDFGAAGAKATGNPIVSIFLHKGAEGYMSNKQFEKFYWPTLRKVIMGLIDQGCMPYVYTEGGFTSRLEIISDVPKGKVIYHVEKDLFEAKKVLGDVACLTGGPPASLLCLGSPSEVTEYCKKCIEVVGKGGGYIMDAAAPIIEAKPENIRAMTDAVMKYGVY